MDATSTLASGLPVIHTGPEPEVSKFPIGGFHVHVNFWIVVPLTGSESHSLARPCTKLLSASSKLQSGNRGNKISTVLVRKVSFWHACIRASR